MNRNRNKYKTKLLYDFVNNTEKSIDANNRRSRGYYMVEFASLTYTPQ